jgi:hypothetical protein
MNESEETLVTEAREYYEEYGLIPVDIAARLSEAGYIVADLLANFDKE